MLEKLKKKLKSYLPKKKKKKAGSGKKSASGNGKSAKSTKTKKSSHYPSYRSVRPLDFREKLKKLFWKCFFYGGAVVAVFITFLWFTLPDIKDLNKVKKAQSILIQSEDGQIIGSFGDVYGEYIKYDEFPTALVDAVKATEDRNFEHHFGVDPVGIIRATVANIRAHRVVQGASTITQQVAKNVFLSPEKSYLRKIKEMLLAFKLESKFSKEEIMSIYLNRVYLGAGSYGMDAAARRYFGKSARDLSLAESAIMAGLLKAPSRYAPSSNPALSRKRADQVLVNMEDAGYLTKAESDKARADLANGMKNRKPNSQSTYYFADYIAEQLPEFIGNSEEDLVVKTTLRPDWQLLAEKSMADVMDKNGEKMNASQSAIIAMSPDGAIRVMLGGRSYAESQYNRATQSLRQPGSSFKPFVYIAGLEAGLTPDSMLNDAPITVSNAGSRSWSPQNYNHKYSGEITMKQALTESINTVAVQISEYVGRDKVIAVARRLGITAEMQPLPSIALGATEVNLLELTNAYAHLASGGNIVYPYGILEIRTNKGKLIYQREDISLGTVLDSGVVGMMNEMLMSVVNNGTARAARIGRDVAGKTGTTSDYKDAWFIGYTPDLVAGVWVGNDDNEAMKKVTGGTLPTSIWAGFMKSALAKTEVKSLPTGGGFLSHLPWNSTEPEVTERPPENATAANDNKPTPEVQSDTEAEIEIDENAPPPKKRKVELGDEFWNKLEYGH